MAGGLMPQGGRGRRGGRLMAEINMTPFVDVVLVLLVIFMVAAPLLTVGIEVDLPETEATPITEEVEPISVTLRADGAVFLQETEVEPEQLVARLTAIAEAGYEHRIYVRADQGLTYGEVMAVTGRIEAAGFKKLALVGR